MNAQSLNLQTYPKTEAGLQAWLNEQGNKIDLHAAGLPALIQAHFGVQLGQKHFESVEKIAASAQFINPVVVVTTNASEKVPAQAQSQTTLSKTTEQTEPLPGLTTQGWIDAILEGRPPITLKEYLKHPDMNVFFEPESKAAPYYEENEKFLGKPKSIVHLIEKWCLSPKQYAQRQELLAQYNTAYQGYENECTKLDESFTETLETAGYTKLQRQQDALRKAEEKGDITWDEYLKQVNITEEKLKAIWAHLKETRDLIPVLKGRLKKRLVDPHLKALTTSLPPGHKSIHSVALHKLDQETQSLMDLFPEVPQSQQLNPDELNDWLNPRNQNLELLPAVVATLETLDSMPKRLSSLLNRYQDPKINLQPNHRACIQRIVYLLAKQASKNQPQDKTRSWELIGHGLMASSVGALSQDATTLVKGTAQPYAINDSGSVLLSAFSHRALSANPDLKRIALDLMEYYRVDYFQALAVTTVFAAAAEDSREAYRAFLDFGEAPWKGISIAEKAEALYYAYAHSFSRFRWVVKEHRSQIPIDTLLKIGVFSDYLDRSREVELYKGMYQSDQAKAEFVEFASHHTLQEINEKFGRTTIPQPTWFDFDMMHQKVRPYLHELQTVQTFANVLSKSGWSGRFKDLEAVLPGLIAGDFTDKLRHMYVEDVHESESNYPAIEGSASTWSLPTTTKIFNWAAHYLTESQDSTGGPTLTSRAQDMANLHLAFYGQPKPDTQQVHASLSKLWAEDPSFRNLYHGMTVLRPDGWGTASILDASPEFWLPIFQCMANETLPDERHMLEGMVLMGRTLAACTGAKQKTLKTPKALGTEVLKSEIKELSQALSESQLAEHIEAEEFPFYWENTFDWKTNKQDPEEPKVSFTFEGSPARLGDTSNKLFSRSGNPGVRDGLSISLGNGLKFIPSHQAHTSKHAQGFAVAGAAAMLTTPQFSAEALRKSLQGNWNLETVQRMNIFAEAVMDAGSAMIDHTDSEQSLNEGLARCTQALIAAYPKLGTLFENNQSTEATARKVSIVTRMLAWSKLKRIDGKRAPRWIASVMDNPAEILFETLNNLPASIVSEWQRSIQTTTGIALALSDKSDSDAFTKAHASLLEVMEANPGHYWNTQDRDPMIDPNLRFR